MFLFAFLVAVAFIPGILDPGTVPRWAVMAAGAPLLLMMRSERLPAPLGGWGVVVLVSLYTGLAWTPDLLTGLDELSRLLILALVFCLGASLDDLDDAWKGLCVGVTVSAVIAIAQAYGWKYFDQASGPAGLFMNKNVLAEAGLVALIASRGRGWLAVGPVVAILIGGSRSVFGVMLVLAAIQLWPRRRVAAVLVGMIPAVTLAFVAIRGSSSLIERFGIWRDALKGGAALFGNGIGSFITAFPWAEHAHSEPLQLAYEHGVFAIPLVWLLWILWRTDGDPTDRIVLAGVVLCGLLAFPFRMPLTAFALALAAGHLARHWHLVRSGADDLRTARGVPYGRYPDTAPDAARAA